MGFNNCDCVDRFDLEDHIMRQLDVCDMIDLVVDRIVEEGTFDEHEVVQTLIGIAKLHKLRNDKLFDVFTRVHELDQYSPNYKSTDVDNTVKRKTDWLYKPCSDSSYSED